MVIDVLGDAVWVYVGLELERMGWKGWRLGSVDESTDRERDAGLFGLLESILCILRVGILRIRRVAKQCNCSIGAKVSKDHSSALFSTCLDRNPNM